MYLTCILLFLCNIVFVTTEFVQTGIVILSLVESAELGPANLRRGIATLLVFVIYLRYIGRANPDEGAPGRGDGLAEAFENMSDEKKKHTLIIQADEKVTNKVIMDVSGKAMAAGIQDVAIAARLPGPAPRLPSFRPSPSASDP